MLTTYLFDRCQDHATEGALLTVERLAALKEQQFGPRDVIISSYPKCGTTFLNEIVSCVLYGGNLEIVNRTQNHERVPCIDFELGSYWETQIEKESFAPEERCFFTHVPWRFLPNQAQKGGCKLINISRNPKDAAVSNYHFHRMNIPLGKQTWTWDEFFDFFTSAFYGPWFDYYLDFYKAGKDKKHILLLKYKDLVKNFDAELDEICCFLDKKLSAEAKATIKEHCQFNSMKNNPMTNRMGVDHFDQNISKFVRKGVVGDFQNYFTTQQNEIFDKIYEERMAGSGLEFDFVLK